MSEHNTHKRFSREPLDATTVRLAVRGEFDALELAGDAGRGFAAGWLTSKIPGLRGVPGGMIGAGSAVIGELWDNFMYGRQGPEAKAHLQAEEVSRIAQYVAHMIHEENPGLAETLRRAGANFVQFVGHVVRDGSDVQGDNMFAGTQDEMRQRFRGAQTRTAADGGEAAEGRHPEMLPDGVGQAGASAGLGYLAGGPAGAAAGLASQPLRNVVDMGTDAAAKWLGMRPNLINRAIEKAKDAMAEVRLLAKDANPELYPKVVAATNALYSYLMRAKQTADMKSPGNTNPNQPTYETLGIK